MVTSIFIQCLKMIDLFEEKCEYVDSLDRIAVKTTEMGVKLKGKENDRTDLEGQNEVQIGENNETFKFHIFTFKFFLTICISK